MLGLSLSLSLGNPILNQGNLQPTPASLLTTAIQQRCRVTCKINGNAAVMEPYALYKTSDKTYLNAVVIYSDKKSLRKFQMKEFEVASQSEVIVTNDQFFPNWAFNASSIEAENLIASVELVEYVQN
ncbi:hypothetical protein [Rhizobium laguerreae]|uniref:hypothetical protein n=1 Tax=Rhizobium laguerreae TaxID=1076926 RepID=UPI001C909DCA|nr:hypothetical protein [Rhizobium laguerreae]MBY3495626.1 hypothetical protein [Rhizobium laguerreae]MBY3543548.1 hypothetical protein [Rhizobium laguerreae]